MEIAKRGATPILKPIPTGKLDWQKWEETIHQPGELKALSKKLDAVSQPKSTLLRIRLKGILFSEKDQDHLATIKEKLESREFLYGSLNDDEMTLSPDNNERIESLPPVFQFAAKKLQEKAAQDPDGWEGLVAKQALLLLFELHKKTSP